MTDTTEEQQQPFVPDGYEPLDEEHHGVGFLAAAGQGIEGGLHEAVPESMLIDGWYCSSCEHTHLYDEPVVFAAAMPQAMIHQRTCPMIPREA